MPCETDAHWALWQNFFAKHGLRLSLSDFVKVLSGATALLHLSETLFLYHTA